MEWLFLTCHNYWIVCRLVRDDDHPYLVYSPEISIKDSSQPFRAFLGAILSVVKGVPVESSAYSPDMGLDTIEEDEDDIADSSGLYHGSSSRGAATDFPRTRSCARDGHENTESELMVHPFLGRYLPLGSLISRLLRLLPNHLKTSTYGYISMPYRITHLPFRCALGTINHTYGLLIL